MKNLLKDRKIVLVFTRIQCILSYCSVRIAVLAFLVLIPVGTLELSGQRLSRDLNVDLLVNQVGYVPQAGKTFVTKGIINGKFEVINLETQKVAYTGVLKPNPGDLVNIQLGISAPLPRKGIII